ncbi:O-antigen translocase [Vibrio alfacsensis]|uniref:oligosaccharide flippase family protein n=1 Tax=Vibrio alfacsensis TaxID=1074311 RepID=UPI001BF13C31|nr:oligosaccharide flippase family protein [Vibrio alfacsensis]BBM65858.1 O-antigen translocase [Vibrio alfacsensis]
MFKSLKPKSEFSRNVLTLMTGTTIAQAIPIAIMPILTRLYTPEDFGVLALFVAITGIFGAIANGRYELAIILPEKDDDAINVAALALFIALFFSVLLSIPAIFLNAEIASLLGNQEIGIWLYFVPFVVFMIGLFNVINYLNTRKKCYKDISKANVYKATSLAFSQLGFGFIRSGVMGLITGQIISHIIANYRLARNTQQYYDHKRINKTEIKRLAIRFIDFPKFSLWAVLCNVSSTHLINILISSVYGISFLGFYSFTQKVLGMPSALIGSSLSQVFFQQASAEKQKKGNCNEVFCNTLKKLILISTLVFIPLFFVVEDLFSIAFGEEWRIAGSYARILMVFFAIRFVSSSLSIVISVFELNYYSLLINVVVFLNSILLLYVTDDFNAFLMCFSVTMSILYLFFVFVYYRVSRYGKFI